MRGFGANRFVWMGGLALAGMLFAGLCVSESALAASGTRFWNLTKNTVNLLQLAPAGSSAYGENLCLADNDKSVDSDERLKISGVKSGRYDVKLGDTAGRQCTVKNIEITEGKVFSIEEKQLTDCKQ